MSSHPISSSGRKNRAVAWARIKVLLSVPVSGLGWLLVALATVWLVSAAAHFIAVALSFFIQVSFAGPRLTIGAVNFDCTTWWGVAVLLLLNLFILVWGWDFIKKGRSMRQSASIHS